ncbi:MAG: racA [Bacillales bacterium]|jgi:chromosome-anchoring protein RacA|nr:racA [Bacillales bacterium]
MNLKTNEVSNILGVSVRTIQRWVKSGKLKPKTSINNSYTFTQDEITNFINNNRANINCDFKQVKRDANSIKALENKLDLLELRLNNKADDVVFVQLINQRKEIDELEKKFNDLCEEIKILQNIIEIEFQNKERKTDHNTIRKGILENIFQNIY